VAQNNQNNVPKPQVQGINRANSENSGRILTIPQETNKKLNRWVPIWRRTKELCICFVLALFPVWSLNMYIEEQTITNIRPKNSSANHNDDSDPNQRSNNLSSSFNKVITVASSQNQTNLSSKKEFTIAKSTRENTESESAVARYKNDESKTEFNALNTL
jgi:hypothetical protein